MDYNNTRSDGMATAALVLGILSILFICCGGSVILGGLGIMFALLSRGGESMDTTARVGLGLSIGSIIINILLIVLLVIFSMRSESYADFMTEFLEEYEYDEDYEYSDPIDEFFNDYFEEEDGFYPAPYEEGPDSFDDGSHMI